MFCTKKMLFQISATPLSKVVFIRAQNLKNEIDGKKFIRKKLLDFYFDFLVVNLKLFDQ